MQVFNLEDDAKLERAHFFEENVEKQKTNMPVRKVPTRESRNYATVNEFGELYLYLTTMN